ncbi:IS630 family transposase domain protein [Candidatus Cyrtobacter comes]|uniref:IS630 family transposase domain protein n=1 Tax=Candidatus Cyrtobacter comes TaxID=675776 RepID=A0ABU5L7V8_9RICK|nr:hypothetical protein [Candidatus Cyrtobacter comes]MDZ5762127.1 IS630 family transposase domain protein [Candidatus Cyrtobacter comes]
MMNSDIKREYINDCSIKQRFAPMIVYCNSDVFMIYVKEFLVKELKRGQVVVMDDIKFHKNADVIEEIKSVVGCEVLFLTHQI